MRAAGATAANASCPRCGAGFRCGMVSGDSACWCVKLPHVLPVPASPLDPTGTTTGVSCFCPACLEKIAYERHNLPSTAGD